VSSHVPPPCPLQASESCALVRLGGRSPRVVLGPRPLCVWLNVYELQEECQAWAAVWVRTAEQGTSTMRWPDQSRFSQETGG